jgi:hypothetical protein
VVAYLLLPGPKTALAVGELVSTSRHRHPATNPTSR